MSAKCHKWGVFQRATTLTHRQHQLLSRHKTRVAAERHMGYSYGHVTTYVRRLRPGETYANSKRKVLRRD